MDPDMVVPEVSAWVFIGRDLHSQLPSFYFQDAVSYLSGARRGADDYLPTLEQDQIPDGCDWGEDVGFEWQRHRKPPDSD
jgi:hypothetical protein